MTDYANLRVTVMGLGRFGGGVGVTRFLAQRGADVLVTDTLPTGDLQDSVAQLADLEAKGQVRYRLGEHNVSDFTTADLVVVNPAVPPDNRFVRAARAASVPLTSEIRLLVKHLPNRLRTIGVTGSAGKSTTTAMIGHILRKALGQDYLTPRRQDAQTPRASPGVWIGGNIGGSLLPHLDEIQPDDWVVLELSSFMLEGLREDRWSPHIAVITNISPNHLDWHGSMESYVAAKQVLTQFQTEGDSAVFGPGLQQMVRTLARSYHLQSNVSYKWSRLKLPGEHNVLNATVASWTCECAGIDAPLAHEALGDFGGLPHRLEFVGSMALPSQGNPRSETVGFAPDTAGVRFYNDSKSTTPEAAILAIESFDRGKVRIILGGYDKGSDFAQLAKVAVERCAGVYTIGKTGDTIAGLVEAQNKQLSEAADVNPRPASAVVRRCRTLDVAVRQTLDDASATGATGQVLVLSPGCASWDQFTNYEQRGARFVELARHAGAR